VLASFAVYLLPIAGPHAVALFGPTLLGGLLRGARPVSWLAAEVTTALGAQGAAALAIYWLIRRPTWPRGLVLALAAPAGTALLSWLYVWAIPAAVLVEGDPAHESGHWPVACAQPGQALAPVRARAGTGPAPLWVIDADGRWARLALPGCAVAPVAVLFNNVDTVLDSAARDGRFLFHRIDARAGRRHWWYAPGDGQAPLRLEPPPSHSRVDGGPILSADGDWVGWLVRIPTRGGSPIPAILVRALGAPRELGASLGELGPAAFSLVDLDMEAQEATLALNDRAFVAIALDGTVRWGPFTPEGLEPLPATFRRAEGGWVAWDGYREADAYHLAWSLPAGKGRHRVRGGRGIAAAAVSPDGRLIAVSVSAAVPVADVPDAVYVLRAADGAEVFRRFLPRGTRSQVAFPTRELFAYTHRVGNVSEVRVLGLPGG